MSQSVKAALNNMRHENGICKGSAACGCSVGYQYNGTRAACQGIKFNCKYVINAKILVLTYSLSY